MRDSQDHNFVQSYIFIFNATIGQVIQQMCWVPSRARSKGQQVEFLNQFVKRAQRELLWAPPVTRSVDTAFS